MRLDFSCDDTLYHSVTTGYRATVGERWCLRQVKALESGSASVADFGGDACGFGGEQVSAAPLAWVTSKTTFFWPATAAAIGGA